MDMSSVAGLTSFEECFIFFLKERDLNHASMFVGADVGADEYGGDQVGGGMWMEKTIDFREGVIFFVVFATIFLACPFYDVQVGCC